MGKAGRQDGRPQVKVRRCLQCRIRTYYDLCLGCALLNNNSLHAILKCWPYGDLPGEASSRDIDLGPRVFVNRSYSKLLGKI